MWGRVVLAAAAGSGIALLIFLSACGEDELPSGNILTPKERYIQQADALCLERRDAGMSAELAYREASANERVKIRRKLAATAAKVQHKLEALPRPETADQSLLEPLFEKMRRQVGALRAGETTDIPGLEELAHRYGFDVCGRA